MSEHTKHDDRLLDALEQLENRSPAQNPPLSARRSDRICQLALKQLHEELGKAQNNTVPFSESFAAKPYGKKSAGIKRTLRTGLVAAALVCVSAVSVYAVGTTLLPMMAEKIRFFDNAPARQDTSPEHAPRGEHEGMALAEAFNAPVNQTVTDNGVSLTLDNISMDIAGLDLYFTVEGQDAIDELIAQNDYMPLWDVLRQASAYFDISLAGNDSAQLIDATAAEDWYVDEAGKIKLWKHYRLTQLPEGDALLLKLHTDQVLGREGNWSFDVSLDGASVRESGRTGQAKLYPLPAEPSESDGLPEQCRDLDLHYLAFGPRGGVMVTNIASGNFTDANGDMWFLTNGSEASEFMIQDNTGKELYATSPATFYRETAPGKESSPAYSVADLTLPDPAATSITLTPMRVVDIDDYENTVVTTQQLTEGMKLPNGPSSGFEVRNFTIEGSSIRYELVPYGSCAEHIELIPHDSCVSAAEGGHTGLFSKVIDPRTGIYSCRLDYYAASPEQVASIENWTIAASRIEPDTEHAITIPLDRLS